MTAPPNCARCDQPMVRVAFSGDMEMFNCRHCVDAQGWPLDNSTGCVSRRWANPAEFDEALRELEIHGMRIL